MVLLDGMHSPHVSPSCLDYSMHRNVSEHIKQFRTTTPRLRSRASRPRKQFKKSISHNETTNLKAESPGKKDLLASFVVIYVMIFFNGCCFTAVVPSVPFYLQFLNAPPEFLGWVVSFYSLGQIFGSPIAGWLSNRLTSKRLLTMSSTLGLLSSALYALAPSYLCIMFSRLLTGISAGMEFTTELTFIARNTTMKERTSYLASVTAVNVVGFIVGPALGTVLANLDIRIGFLTIDQYTGPGWLLAAMFLLDLIMVQYFFKDHDEYDSAGNGTAESSERVGLLKSKEQPDDHSSRSGSYGGVNMHTCEEHSREESGVPDPSDTRKATNDDGTLKEPPPSLPLVLSLIFVQFSLMCGFSLLETITSPLVQDQFDWNVRDCNLLFTCGGFVSLTAYIGFVVASKWVQDRKLVINSLLLSLMGFLLGIDWQQLDWVPSWMSDILPPYVVRFLAGFALMNAGFVTGRPVVFALYSKLIARQYQGRYLGWMVAGGSAARTLGPFAAVSIYYGIKVPGDNLLALFGSFVAFNLACIVLMLCQWPQLLPGNPEMSLPITKNGTSAKQRGKNYAHYLNERETITPNTPAMSESSTSREHQAFERAYTT